MRRQLFHRLVGQDAKVILGGLTLLDEPVVQTPRCKWSMRRRPERAGSIYRAIVDDEAVGIFQGKVIVEHAAQKTDGAMKSQAVLLSQHAQMNAKPELEIFADDVVCGHGATVGSLDPEQLFYMMARGISEAKPNRCCWRRLERKRSAVLKTKFWPKRCGCRFALGSRGSERLELTAKAGGFDGACFVNDVVRASRDAYDVERVPPGFSNPRRTTLWQVARLSRQRGVRAETESRH